MNLPRHFEIRYRLKNTEHVFVQPDSHMTMPTAGITPACTPVWAFCTKWIVINKIMEP
jgi:hypothetical protein